MPEAMDVAWMVNVDEGNVLISNEWIPLLGDCVLNESLAGVELSIGLSPFFRSTQRRLRECLRPYLRGLVAVES